MKRSLFLIFSIILYWTSHAQENSTVNVHFEGKEFDKLNLIVVLPDMQSERGSIKVKITGESENGKDWVFCYPDSLYDKHWLTKIELQTISDTLVEVVAFGTIHENDTLLAGQYCFSRGISNINAVYLGTRSFRKIYGDPITHIGYFKTQIQYQFLISSQPDKQLLSSIEGICYGYSSPDKLDSISYQKQLVQYENLTKKYPDSHFLTFWFNSNLSAYKSKSDIAQIYNAFSDENKKSYYGKQINNFLASNETEFEYAVFENCNLPVWNSDQVEPIVQDTATYNLVVFSASWCRPCHLLLPLLKEIYNNFKNDLNITYVSLDEEITLKDWGNLLNSEDIPWRSLLAKDNLQEMKDKYFAIGIPHTILVYPGGKKAEILNLQLDKDYKKFVSLMKI